LVVIKKFTLAISPGSGILHSIVNQQTKGKQMNQLTVAELIRILQALPNQDASVYIAINQEYQCEVVASDVHDYGDTVIIGE
jgi:DNA polymerase III epsilon subunit-like protein